MPDETCIIPGCNQPAEHNLGIRLRRPDTSAIWAPNTTAFLCDEHAVCGMDVTIRLTPNRSEHVDVLVVGEVPKITTKRRTPIVQGAK